MKKIISMIAIACSVAVMGCNTPGSAGSGAGAGNGTLTKAKYLELAQCAIDKTGNAELKDAWSKALEGYKLIPDATWDTAMKNIPQSTIDEMQKLCN